jgi:hypothetical protein
MALGEIFFWDFVSNQNPNTNEYLNECYFLVFSLGDKMRIGEVFVDGQNRNVWCNSKNPILLPGMYLNPGLLTDPYYATTSSCYYLMYQKASSRVQLLMANSEECALSHQIMLSQYFLCE